MIFLNTVLLVTKLNTIAVYHHVPTNYIKNIKYLERDEMVRAFNSVRRFLCSFPSWAESFLCGVCMSSPCLCESFSYIPKTCMLDFGDLKLPVNGGVRLLSSIYNIAPQLGSTTPATLIVFFCLGSFIFACVHNGHSVLVPSIVSMEIKTSVLCSVALE